MLLQLRAEDDVNLKTWLSRKTTFTSGEIQNEILQLMSHAILRNICSNVNEMSTHFGLVTDGTQDIQGNEQESVCVRYVTDSFDVQEDLIGLYQVSSTTGVSLCKMLQDVLIRCQLPIEHLRAQTYDGASNMSGKYKGCQAQLKKTPTAGQLCSLWSSCHPTHYIQSPPNCTVHKRLPWLCPGTQQHLQQLWKIQASVLEYPHWRCWHSLPYTPEANLPDALVNSFSCREIDIG